MSGSGEPGDPYDLTLNDAWASEVADRIVPTAWTAVTFENSWTNAAGGYQAAEYRKVGDMVHFRGRIAGGSSGTAAFTLPAGFRPPGGLSLPAIYAISTPGLCLINIEPAGSVIVYGTNVSITGFNYQFSVTA